MAPETHSPLTRNPARASAWLQTVINPLIRTLQLEIAYLGRQSWTWRFHLGRFELLQPCRDQVGGLYVENLDDLASRRADLGRRFDAHDARLEELQRALAAGQQALESDKGFVQAVEHARTSHASSDPSDRPHGAFAPEQLVPLAAQFVLNAVDPELARSGGDTTMAEFWYRHHAALQPFGTRHLAVIRPLGDALLAESRSLQAALVELRTELTDTFDLPPVPVE